VPLLTSHQLLPLSFPTHRSSLFRKIFLMTKRISRRHSLWKRRIPILLYTLTIIHAPIIINLSLHSIRIRLHHPGGFIRHNILVVYLPHPLHLLMSHLSWPSHPFRQLLLPSPQQNPKLSSNGNSSYGPFHSTNSVLATRFLRSQRRSSIDLTTNPGTAGLKHFLSNSGKAS
jgi:hypothetical protein